MWHVVSTVWLIWLHSLHCFIYSQLWDQSSTLAWTPGGCWRRWFSCLEAERNQNYSGSNEIGQQDMVKQDKAKERRYIMSVGGVQTDHRDRRGSSWVRASLHRSVCLLPQRPCVEQLRGWRSSAAHREDGYQPGCLHWRSETSAETRRGNKHQWMKKQWSENGKKKSNPLPHGKVSHVPL